MLSLLISALVSITLVGALTASGIKRPTTIFFGIFGFIAAFYLVGWLVRKKIAKVQKELEEIMKGAQQRMTRKVQQFQSKPGGNIKQLQRQMEADQKAVYKQGLDFIPRLVPFMISSSSFWTFAIFLRTSHPTR